MGHSLTDHWIEASLQQLKGKLGIYGDGTRVEAWRNAVGDMDPAEYYRAITRDLPGHVEIMIDSKGSGSSEVTLTCKQGRDTLFTANNMVHRNPLQKEIHFEEWRAGEIHDGKSAAYRAERGLGTILFSNILDLMKPLELEKITLRAGRESGATYWARRGARVEESGPYLSDLTRIVGENYNALRSRLDPETCVKIDEILSNPTPYANVQLARIEGSIDDRKIHDLLLKNTNPRCIIKTNDEMQMSMVRHYLGNIDAIRSKVRDDFQSQPQAIETSNAQPSAAQQPSSQAALHLKH